MSSSKEHVKVVVACQCCRHLAYNVVCYVNSRITSGGLKKQQWSIQWQLQVGSKPKHCNNSFNLNLSIMKTNACLVVKKPNRRAQLFSTIPSLLNFGLTGTSNGLGPQPTLGGTSSKTQKLNRSTLKWQTTCVGGYQPDICCDNTVAGLKVHTEMMNRFSLSALGTGNSYSEHKLHNNDVDTSDSITSEFLIAGPIEGWLSLICLLSCQWSRFPKSEARLISKGELLKQKHWVSLCKTNWDEIHFTMAKAFAIIKLIPFWRNERFCCCEIFDGAMFVCCTCETFDCAPFKFCTFDCHYQLLWYVWQFKFNCCNTNPFVCCTFEMFNSTPFVCCTFDCATFNCCDTNLFVCCTVETFNGALFECFRFDSATFNW